MNLTEPRLRRLARVCLVLVVVGFTASIALELAAGRADEAVFTTLLLSFPVVGFLVLSRRPDNRLAWLMVAMGVLAAITGPLQGYGAYAVERDLPNGPLALALAGPGWVPFIAISGFLLLLFPDGHLPSPRWRWFAWLCGVSLTIVFVTIWFYPGDFADSGYPEVVNPIGVEATRTDPRRLPVPLALGAAAGGGRVRLAGRAQAPDRPTTSSAIRSAGSRTPHR